MGPQKAPRVIKRYANRKLYDMTESCYITHEEIAALLENGEELRIIDNKTKEDLTSATLTQILFDMERKNRKSLPIETLKNLFAQSGEFIQRHIPPALRRAAEKDRETAAPEPVAAEPIADDGSHGPRAKATEAIREFVTGTTNAYENLTKNVEDRWNLVTRYLGQFDVNHKRILELERRIDQLEERIAELEGAGGGESAA
ncbi:MAG: polyhydroxyalkanoate synthesis regulator DNA-binding domain-containing protein [Deltaproteobacteria bacterium]|nr:polyhydroxyalkanoate synthesis regulator DNA-binding domain-containing protein [Deltaproteobacteria bacterium]